MINFGRVFAMVKRHYFNMIHNYDRLTDMFYWPAMDLFIWGVTGLYFARLNANNPHFIEIVLGGLVFWIVIWRAQYEININLLNEFWDRNLVNIFISPLKTEEWMLSFLIFGGLKMLVSLAFSAILAFFLYEYNVFIYGFYLIPFVFSLLITGWAAGFLVASLLIMYGQKIQTFAWMGVVLIAPFSGLYYPISSLPVWAQKVALLVPSSYIFEGMREVLVRHTISYDTFIISFALNILYLILAVYLFITMFHKSRKLGFGRLV